MPPAHGTPEAVFHTEWIAALERLDADLAAAERLAGDPTATPAATQPGAQSPWQPPVIPGPMPTYLADRARLLLERQRSVMSALAGQAQLLRQQAAFAVEGGLGQQAHEASIVDIHV